MRFLPHIGVENSQGLITASSRKRQLRPCERKIHAKRNLTDPVFSSGSAGRAARLT